MFAGMAVLKTGLVFFWSAWLTAVFLTNRFEGLQRLGILPESWKFASQNYAKIQKTVAVYSPPPWLAGLLFAGVILWQCFSLALLWNAFRLVLLAGFAALPQVDTAFIVLIALFGAFMLADEIFRAYDNQSSHMLIFIAQLATLLVFHLL